MPQKSDWQVKVAFGAALAILLIGGALALARARGGNESRGAGKTALLERIAALEAASAKSETELAALESRAEKFESESNEEIHTMAIALAKIYADKLQSDRITGAPTEGVTRLQTLQVDFLFAKEIVVKDRMDPELVDAWARLNADRETKPTSLYLSSWLLKLEDEKGHALAAISPGHLQLLGENNGRLTAEANGSDGRAEIRLFQGAPHGRDYSVMIAGEQLETHQPPK